MHQPPVTHLPVHQLPPVLHQPWRLIRSYPFIDSCFQGGDEEEPGTLWRGRRPGATGAKTKKPAQARPAAAAGGKGGARKQRGGRRRRERVRHRRDGDPVVAGRQKGKTLSLSGA